MENIEIKITIPKSEYMTWVEYLTGKTEGCKDILKDDLKWSFERLGIDTYEMEINIKP